MEAKREDSDDLAAAKAELDAARQRYEQAQRAAEKAEETAAAAADAAKTSDDLIQEAKTAVQTPVEQPAEPQPATPVEQPAEPQPAAPVEQPEQPEPIVVEPVVVETPSAAASGATVPPTGNAGAYPPPPTYAAPASEPRTAYNQPPVYGQAPVYAPTKDHVAAGLLAILLGPLGIHKFYLGYTNAGFIMLGVAVLGSILSLGIAWPVIWVIAIIEGITYLSKSQQEFEEIYVKHTKEWF